MKKSIATITNEYASICAEAYTSQFFTESRVADNPAIIWDSASETLSWTSSANGAGDGEVVVEVLEKNCYGDDSVFDNVQDLADISESIRDMILYTVDQEALLEKLDK